MRVQAKKSRPSWATKGLKPVFAFGNPTSDADAYNNAAIEPLTNRIFFPFTDSAWHGRRVEAYGPSLAELGKSHARMPLKGARAPPVCRTRRSCGKS